MNVKDLHILVTGASSGMGKHFALGFCRAAAKVAAFDVDEKGLEALATQAKDLPGELKIYKTNVAVEEEVVSQVDKAWSDLGFINGLINNAGIFRDGLLVRLDKATGQVITLSKEHWQAVIDVDLTGPFLMTREVASRMVQHGIKPGVIINISSVSRHGNAGQSNYSAAKAGLVADTKLWASELARYGIRVGAVAPGFIRTPILDAMRPEMLQKMMSLVPLQRLGEPEEILTGIRFIIECDYFTGKCLDIDGGVML